MEKNIQMTASSNIATTFCNVKNAMKDALKTPFVMMRDYYSSVIGKEISNRQAWLITELQLAFIAVIFPAEMSFLLRLVALLWLISSALRTKASFE